MVLSRDKKKLHWVAEGKQSDWDGLTSNKMNIWQKIAAPTYGLVTIGNVLSFAGLYFVIAGLKNVAEGVALVGLAQVLIGRLFDIFDGISADVTKTKSIVGAKVDAILDTFQLVVALVVLVEFDIIPLFVALLIAVPKALNALGYSAAVVRHKRVNTTAQSKIATLFLWSSIVMFLVAHITRDMIPNAIDVVGWGLMIAAVVLTIPSTVEYLRIGFTSKKQKA